MAHLDRLISPALRRRQAGQEIVAALDDAPFTRSHAVFVVALLTALVFDQKV